MPHRRQCKHRNFLEIVGLQISLKNDGPQEDKCFSGTIKFKCTLCPKFSVCMLKNQQPCDDVTALALPGMAKGTEETHNMKSGVRKTTRWVKVLATTASGSKFNP